MGMRALIGKAARIFCAVSSTRSSSPAPKGIVEGLGFTLAMVGLAIVVDTGDWSQSLLRALMLATGLLLAGLGAPESGVRDRRAISHDRLLVGSCICAGLFALWRFAMGVQPPMGSASSWTGLVGCMIILSLTWRCWGAHPALIGLATLIYGVFWWLGHVDMASLNAISAFGSALWFSLDDGALGWLLETLLSTVLPFFLLGGVLACRMTLGSTVGSQKVASAFGSNLTPALQHAVQLLLPTLVMGALIMTERPGIDVSIITGVLSLGQCALVALVIVIAFSVFDANIRRHPVILLRALARSGAAFGRLLVLASTVGMILAVLDRTGLPLDLAQVLVAISGEARLPLIVLAAVASIAFGSALPGLAAYLIVVTLIGPALRTVGLAEFTVHLFVLFPCTIASATVAMLAASRAPTLPISQT